MSARADEALAPWRPGGDGPWDRAAASHLFRRAGFGARPAELELALERGFEATLAEILTRESDGERAERLGPLLSAGEPDYLRGWWIDLCVRSPAQLVERMTLLWHNHFATSYAKVRDVRLMHAQNELFRTHGLGDFRVLLRAVLRDPAMLVWLDGDANRAGRPNENLAREVLELFALGLGHYGEEDVRELARALTGLGVDGRRFVWRGAQHDGDVKRILGRSGTFGCDGALEALFAHPACAEHVARRMLSEFVAPAPAAAEVAATATRLRELDWHVGRTVEAILRSRLFFAPPARRARIAGPVELVCSTVRALDLEMAPAQLAAAAGDMGQRLFEPPSVKGWNGGRGWINAATWLARTSWTAELVAARPAPLLRSLDGPPETLVERVVARLLPEGVGAEALAVLRDAAAAHAASEAERARAVALLVLSSPDYHLY